MTGSEWVDEIFLGAHNKDIHNNVNRDVNVRMRLPQLKVRHQDAYERDNYKNGHDDLHRLSGS